MIDWLRREQADPVVELPGRTLPIALRRHPTARRMTMRLAPDGSEVRITLPRWGRTAEALAFAESRKDWLAGQLAAQPAAQPPGDGGIVRFRGEELTISWDASAPRKPQLSGGTLTIGGPAPSLPARLQRWLESEGLTTFRTDLEHYCDKAGIANPPPVRISRAQRRWGSCSSDGTVRINWRLIQAPEPVRRSVVAHEVAHLVHFDHSPAFHALLGTIFEGSIAEANSWLRREGRSLYSSFG